MFQKDVYIQKYATKGFMHIPKSALLPSEGTVWSILDIVAYFVFCVSKWFFRLE